MKKKALWDLNRREFIKGLAAIGIVSQFGFFEACTNLNTEKGNSFFSKFQMKELKAVASILFPDNGNGPNISEINVLPHILWTLQDKVYGYDAYDMFLVSLEALDKYSKDTLNTSFSLMTELEMTETITAISKLKWGDRFLSNTMNYIFEALIIDPAYHVNGAEKGWDWLQHSPGQPRPNTSDLYPNFLNRL